MCFRQHRFLALPLHLYTCKHLKGAIELLRVFEGIRGGRPQCLHGCSSAPLLPRRLSRRLAGLPSPQGCDLGVEVKAQSLGVGPYLQWWWTYWWRWRWRGADQSAQIRELPSGGRPNCGGRQRAGGSAGVHCPGCRAGILTTVVPQTFFRFCFCLRCLSAVVTGAVALALPPVLAFMPPRPFLPPPLLRFL